MGFLQPLPHGQVGNMGIHWAWERQDIKEPPLFPVSVKITATFKKNCTITPLCICNSLKLSFGDWVLMKFVLPPLFLEYIRQRNEKIIRNTYHQRSPTISFHDRVRKLQMVRSKYRGQNLHRVCTGSAQGLHRVHRVCTGSAQGLAQVHRMCAGCAQDVRRVCAGRKNALCGLPWARPFLIHGGQKKLQGLFLTPKMVPLSLWGLTYWFRVTF